MTNGERGFLGLKKSGSLYGLGRLIFAGAVIGTTMRAVDAGLDHISQFSGLGKKISDYRQRKSEIRELESEKRMEKMADVFSEKFIERLEKYFENKSRGEYG